MTMIVGTGITIAFSSGFLAEIQDVTWSGIHRDSIKSSHAGTTTAHTFSPSDLYDPGELQVEIHHDPSVKPPINGAAENITVTWPDAGAATWVVSGFMTDYEVKSPLEDKIIATATLKLSGDVTVTP